MKIKSEQVYTVEFTEGQWESVRDIIKNISEINLGELGFTLDYQNVIMRNVREMRDVILREELK